MFDCGTQVGWIGHISIVVPHFEFVMVRVMYSYTKEHPLLSHSCVFSFSVNFSYVHSLEPLKQ
jgi:hypothetical protein